MGRIEFSETVACPRAEVWAYIIDPDTAPDWISFADKVVADGPPALGTKTVTTASLMGVKFTTENEVVEFDELERYTIEGDSPFPLRMQYDLEEVDADTTHLKATIDLDPGKFFKVGGRILIKQIEKQSKKDAKNLKRILES